MSTNKNYLKLVDHIKKHQEDFYRLAYGYVKNREEALDIVQESVYKALTSVDKIKDISNINTWMYKIIVNTSINHINKNKRLILMDDMSNSDQTEEPDIASSVDLYDAIEKLNEKDKTVVMLRYFEDMKIDDIAVITKTNTNTVKSRMYSAIKKLKKIIEGEV